MEGKWSSDPTAIFTWDWAMEDLRAIHLETARIRTPCSERFYELMLITAIPTPYRRTIHSQTAGAERKSGHTACAIRGDSHLIAPAVIYILPMLARIPGKRLMSFPCILQA